MAQSLLIGFYAGITFWFPKMFGKMLDERLGKIHFWGTIIPFNLIFLPLFMTGLGGDHRRIYNYEHFPELAQLQDLRILATVSLVVMLIFQVVFFVNFVKSLIGGKPAGKNPWRSTTLEWTTESPAPHGNWEQLPAVYRGPYEYGTPGREEDYWPQNAPS